ncbi:DUF1254 domain-containing protein [Novosphingobium sp. M1R2S20]|uniref:DUF1254 domain-containing protein n=1 Tax=Novosphingobium rhizovicinum TaxID=3228928 RepID=A0ABV3R8Y9_9SPHN
MTWEALNAAVTEARALIANRAPDPETAAEGESYITRVVAAGLSGAVLGHLLKEDGLGRPLPVYGGPNPDYLMRHAGIDPSRSYRLDGRINGSERLGIGLYKPGVAGGTPIEVGYISLSRTDCDSDGRFFLDLVSGDAADDKLAISPEARILLVRILHRDPDSEPARLRLSGAAPSPGLALMMGSNDAALGFVAHTLGVNVREYMRWTDAVQAHPNRLAGAPPELAEAVQGDPDTQYFLGSYDLADGEQLRVTMPAGISGYWSVHAYDYWFQYLQTPGVHDRNARADADGRVRLTIAPDGVQGGANAIDTLGRRKGSLICRVIGGCRVDPPAAEVQPAR